VAGGQADHRAVADRVVVGVARDGEQRRLLGRDALDVAIVRATRLIDISIAGGGVPPGATGAVFVVCCAPEYHSRAASPSPSVSTASPS